MESVHLNLQNFINFCCTDISFQGLELMMYVQYNIVYYCTQKQKEEQAWLNLTASHVYYFSEALAVLRKVQVTRPNPS